MIAKFVNPSYVAQIRSAEPFPNVGANSYGQDTLLSALLVWWLPWHGKFKTWSANG